MGTLNLQLNSMDRRSLLRNAVAGSACAIVGAGILNLHSASAQEATPESGSAVDDLDLPLLEVTISADGSFTAPAEFAAGTIRLRVASELAVGGTFMFIQPPAGITEEDIQAALSAPGIPDFLFQSVVNGGVELMPGDGQSDALVQELVFDLGAGSWYLAQVSETPSYQMLTATGEPVLVEVPAAVEVALSEYDFTIDAEVPAGAGVWKVTNVDPTLHHMIIFSYPDALTDEQALDLLLSAEGMATPPAGLDPAKVGVVGSTGMLSIDQSAYQTFDLQPGTHFATCFIADAGVDMPHAMQGMIQVFTAVG